MNILCIFIFLISLNN